VGSAAGLTQVGHMTMTELYAAVTTATANAAQAPLAVAARNTAMQLEGRATLAAAVAARHPEAVDAGIDFLTGFTDSNSRTIGGRLLDGSLDAAVGLFPEAAEGAVRMRARALFHLDNASTTRYLHLGDPDPIAVPIGGGLERLQGGARVVVIDGSKYPESARHAQDAIDLGINPGGVVDRNGAKPRRRTRLKNEPKAVGLDRDEFPPAILDNGGAGHSVRAIAPSDNRGAGSSIRHQLDDVPNGTPVIVKPINVPPRTP